MATNQNYTRTAPIIEFVRRDTDGGFLLVRQEGPRTTVTPVETTVKREGNRLIIGLAPKPIKINWPGGQTTFLQVQDGVYPNPETNEWEVWLDGEPCAWCDSEGQANRSMNELLREPYK